MNDLEILDIDLLEYAGLTHISLEERAGFIERTDELFGMATLIQAGNKLVEKDQEIFANLLENEEIEKANALLSLRGINMEFVFFDEVLRVKRAIIESGAKFHFADDLEFAIKVLMPPEVIAAKLIASGNVAEEINQLIDKFPVPEESKNKFRDTVHKGIELEADIMLDSLMPPEIKETVNEYFETGKEKEAISLLMMNGIDIGEIYNEAALVAKQRVLNELQFFNDIIKEK